MAEQPDEIIINDTDATGGTAGTVSTGDVKAAAPNASETEAVQIVAQRHDIEHTRQDISATLDALKEKLSPQVLMDQAKEHAKEVAVDAIDQAKENVKENIGTAMHNASDTVSDAVSTAKDKVADVVQNVSDTVSSAVQSAKDKVSDVFGGGKDKTADVVSIDDTVSTIRSGSGSSTAYPTRKTNTINTTMGGIMDGAKGAGTTVIETIKRNPLPTALIGAGALYLYMQHRDSGATSTYRSSDYDYTDYDAVYTPTDTVETTGEPVIIDDIIIIETDEGVDGISDLSANDYAVSAPPYVPSASASTGTSGSSLLTTVQSNPLPAALAILGVTWLFLKNRDDNKTPRYNDYTDYETYTPPISSRVNDVVGTVKGKAGQVSDTVSDAVSSAKDKVSDTVSSVSDKVGDTVSTAKDKAGDMVDAARQKASDAADAAKSAVSTAKSKVGDATDAAKTAVGTAKSKAVQVSGQAKAKAADLSASALEQTRKAGGAVADTYQANPLAYGLVALGIGAAVGLLVPGTDQENKLMGQTRDQLFTKAQASVQDITTKVQAVAETTLEQAKTGLNTTLDTAKTTVVEQAKAQGLTGE